MGTTLQVDFLTELDLAPFMSNRRGPPQAYSLYGVLVHSGHSVHSGHYFAFVKAPNGLWHQLDDNHVSQVSFQSCSSMSCVPCVPWYMGGWGKEEGDGRVAASIRCTCVYFATIRVTALLGDCTMLMIWAAVKCWSS